MDLVLNLSRKSTNKKQCTLEGQALYVNVWGSVHWKRANLGVLNFFNGLLKLTNQK